ncbi:hypothetical protein DPSP01_012978 [Paraphaeosphaeria sporulosa]
MELLIKTSIIPQVKTPAPLSMACKFLFNCQRQPIPAEIRLLDMILRSLHHSQSIKKRHERLRKDFTPLNPDIKGFGDCLRERFPNDFAALDAAWSPLQVDLSFAWGMYEQGFVLTNIWDLVGFLDTIPQQSIVVLECALRASHIALTYAQGDQAQLFPVPGVLSLPAPIPSPRPDAFCKMAIKGHEFPRLHKQLQLSPHGAPLGLSTASKEVRSPDDMTGDLAGTTPPFFSASKVRPARRKKQLLDFDFTKETHPCFPWFSWVSLNLSTPSDIKDVQELQYVYVLAHFVASYDRKNLTDEKSNASLRQISEAFRLSKSKDLSKSARKPWPGWKILNNSECFTRNGSSLIHDYQACSWTATVVVALVAAKREMSIELWEELFRRLHLPMAKLRAALQVVYRNNPPAEQDLSLFGAIPSCVNMAMQSM